MNDTDDWVPYETWKSHRVAAQGTWSNTSASDWVKAMNYGPKQSMLEMVKEFHQKMGQPILNKIDTEANRCLRLDLIQEEIEELELASDQCNVVKVADGLGDILYVTLGAALAWGIDIERVFAEIHRSNMTKSPGNLRADGKILKGPEYSPPDLSFLLEA